jgi:hypothetical protein
MIRCYTPPLNFMELVFFFVLHGFIVILPHWISWDLSLFFVFFLSCMVL